MYVTERSVEIPFALNHLPSRGIVLDVGSNEASYLSQIPKQGLVLHCLDPRPRDGNVPEGVQFFQRSIIDSGLPMNYYDAILAISTVEHIGLPHYDQPIIRDGDKLALHSIYHHLRPDGYLVLTVPVGAPKDYGWFRQYSIGQLKRLLERFSIEKLETYGLSIKENRYFEIGVKAVPTFDYNTMNGVNRAGAVACVIARKLA